MALALLMPPRSASAGAWTQLPGSFFVKLSFSHSRADEQLKCCVDETQPLLSATDRGTVRENALYLYGEYGLPFDIPGGLTVMAQASFKWLEIDSERALRTTSGFSDVGLGLRWGLPIEAIQPVVLSIQVEAKIPTGYTANLPNGERIPWLGNGVFEVTSSLLAGVSFWPVPIYITGGAGFRWRGEDENEFGPVDYENEIPWAVDVGGEIAGRVIPHVTLDGIAPLGAPEEIGIAALTPPSSRVLRFTGGVIVRIWEGLQADFHYTRVLDGVNVTLADQFTFGVAWAQ